MKILILTRDFHCKVVLELSKNSTLKVDVSDNYQNISSKYDIVFAHNYDRIIPEEYFEIPKLGIFVIHSTDLPKGRGWAPIYYSIVNKEKIYTISLLKISKNIDEGNIFMKLKIEKPLIITNNNLREIDEDGTILLINKFIDLYKKGYITKTTKGLKQNNQEATYNKKRTPEDNLIDSNLMLKDAIFLILATNEEYPAFIEIDNEKIFLNALINKFYLLKELNYYVETFI